MSSTKDISKREWTDDEVAELILLYEAQEFLWNVKHKLYRNRDKKNSMFDEIAKKFSNCDGSEVQRKIHNLRNQVSHEIQKIKKMKSGDGAEDKYESKWKFFSALKFIIPSFTPTKSTSNIEHTEESSEVVEDDQTNQPTKKSRKTPTKKKVLAPEDEILQEAVEIMKKPKDDFDRFGEYVAMELKTMKSEYYRGQLKSAIRKAIVEYSDKDDTAYWSGATSSSSSSVVHSPSPTLTGNVVNSPLLDIYDEGQTTQQYYNTVYTNM